jgi:hypothetical protein
VPVIPGGGVIPTLSIVTSTVSRSVNSSACLNPVPGQSIEFRELNSAFMESLNPLNNSLTLSKGS